MSLFLDSSASTVTPSISVTKLVDPITMGQTANFEIRSTPVVANAINVNFEVSSVGNTLLWRAPKTIEVSGKTPLSFVTNIDRENLDSEHSVSVTILAGDGYEVASEEPTTITVESIAPDSPNVEPPSVAIADAVVNAILSLDFSESQSASPTLIERSTEPVIAISAKSDRIQEGQNAELKVKSSVATFASVQIAVTETGDFIVKNIPEFVQFNGNLDFNLSIPTQDDQIAEDDGAVIVSIAKGEGYSIANSPSNQASVLISDANDRTQYNEKTLCR